MLGDEALSSVRARVFGTGWRRRMATNLGEPAGVVVYLAVSTT